MRSTLIAVVVASRVVASGRMARVDIYERKDQTRIGCSGALCFIPVSPGCLFQAYDVEALCGPVRG